MDDESQPLLLKENDKKLQYEQQPQVDEGIVEDVEDNMLT